MLSVNNIGIQFSGEPILEDVTFVVNDKERIGLVGKNGAGKTTLLNIIAGIQEATKGDVAISNNSIGYLPQDKVSQSTLSVYDEAKTAFVELLELEKKREQLTQEILTRNDYNTNSYLELCDTLHHVEERYVLLSEGNIDVRLEKVLSGLGFLRNEWTKPLNTFSSGWQMRVELAKILLKNPDVILLDEPTNHLDIESIQWLETYLENYHGAVIVVSHDRTFLDSITTRTIEIISCKITDYKVPYSEYVLVHEERRKTQIATVNNQQREIEHIENFIERFRYKSSKAKQVQSRIKMLEKFDIVEVDETDTSAIHFRFPAAPPSGKIVFEASQLSKSYEDKEVLHELEFAIIKSDRLAFVGRNGEGKTTLSKILVGSLDYTGICKKGYNISIGYYPQNPELLLDMEKTVFQTIDDIAVGDMRAKVKSLLGGFLFSGEALDKKVKVLSGGEKARLAIAKLLLFPVNVLVLDEPTNHLDMRSKDILKSALLQFTGTIIVVSHDRDFLSGLTNRTFEFKNKQIKEHIGDIQEFLNQRKLEQLNELEIQKNNTPEDAKLNIANKERYEQKKLQEKSQRKTEKQIEKYEKRILELEAQLAQLDLILSNPEEYQNKITDENIYCQYENLTQELNEVTELWEKLIHISCIVKSHT
jgi:ATP-binding cassette subfamily F protein 3